METFRLYLSPRASFWFGMSNLNLHGAVHYIFGIIPVIKLPLPPYTWDQSERSHGELGLERGSPEWFLKAIMFTDAFIVFLLASQWGGPIDHLLVGRALYTGPGPPDRPRGKPTGRISNETCLLTVGARGRAVTNGSGRVSWLLSPVIYPGNDSWVYLVRK